MRKFKVGKISWVAFILVAFAAGCGREQAPVLVPAVIVTSPLNIATGVVLNSTVTAGFNIAMTPATINATTFTLVGPGAVAVTGTVTYTGTTATLTPTASLAANTLYVGTITIGAQSANGVAMAANYVWSFTTGAPTVISTVPAGGATLVAVNTLVSATFSEPMNAATINGVTFTLTGPGVTPVAGAVTYAGTTATFTPATVLAANTLFTATITTGAQDPAGAALAANFVWTFTTVSQPKVTSTNPTSGATNVPINQKITATFSEPMSSSTIVAAGTFTVAPTLGELPSRAPSLMMQRAIRLSSRQALLSRSVPNSPPQSRRRLRIPRERQSRVLTFGASPRVPSRTLRRLPWFPPIR